MTRQIRPEIRVAGNRHILFDAGSLTGPGDELFCREELARRGLVTGVARGRGETCFLRWGEEEWVLRHYRRGGVVAKVVDDVYFGSNPGKTRSWREWRLLAELYAQGLPVPRPVAARAVMNRGGYRADLVTVRIPRTQTLSHHLLQEPLAADDWIAIGACLGRFHAAGVYHADLNAGNILLGEEQSVYLIDFDRGALRPPGRWQSTNLARLFRSLRKFKRRSADFHFTPEDWTRLLEGYRASADINSR